MLLVFKLLSSLLASLSALSPLGGARAVSCGDSHLCLASPCRGGRMTLVQPASLSCTVCLVQSALCSSPSSPQLWTWPGAEARWCALVIADG